MQPRSFYAGLALVVCLLAIIALVPASVHDVTVLERLAPRIERAQVLTPEAKTTIATLLDRVRDAVTDPRDQKRRELAIQRVTDALNVKDGLGNTGQGAPTSTP